MKNVRITKPAIEIGYLSDATQATVNGQAWDGTNRVAGAVRGGNGPVVAVRSGRKLVMVGTGGLYPARTTH